MAVEQVKIARIKPNPNNPRVIKDEKFTKLVKSIADFPEMLFKRPLVCVTDTDGKLFPLGGNMRLKAFPEALKLMNGKAKMFKDGLPVELADEWTEEQRREFVIKDNVGFGEWDWEMIGNEWDAQQLTDWGLDIPDFKVEQEAEEDDYEIPDTIETDIVLGDLFEIGPHRLLCGDSTNSDAVAKVMNGDVADLVFTDPPYGVSYQSNMREKSKKFDVLLNDDQFITDWINCLPIFSKGFVFVWTSWKVIDKWIEFCSPLGELSNIIIWNKGGGGMGDLKGSFAVDYELALVYNRDAQIVGKRLGSVWDVKRHNTNEYKHPTQKPVQLAAMAIENITTHRGLVMDLFLGSGTTMIASHQLGRKCYGMELDPKYCQVIVDRMRKLDPSIEIKRNGQLWQPL